MKEQTETMVPEQEHRLTLDGRSRLKVTGVKDVESFDEAMVVLVTVRGTLVVRGEGLHLAALSPEGGEVAVNGTVDSMIYEQDAAPKRGFWGRFSA